MQHTHQHKLDSLTSHCCVILFVIILFSTKILISSCDAAPLAFLRTFSHWDVYYELKRDGTKMYYALSAPVSTKVHSGLRNSPYIAVSYIGYRMYTISVYPGFIVDTSYPFTLRTTNHTYFLRVLQDSVGNTNYSVDDVLLINEFIKNHNKPVEVRSYDTNASLAVDYYDISNLKDALMYIERQAAGN